VPSSKVRRLFDIMTKHVSLVDRAANNKQFLIVKRDNKGKEINMDVVEYLKEIMPKIEKSINDLAEEITELKKKEATPLFEIDVDKAGAKFSTKTLGELKTLRDSIVGLIGETSVVTENVSEDIEKRDYSVEELVALAKNSETEIAKKNKDRETSVEKLTKILTEVLTENKNA